RVLFTRTCPVTEFGTVSGKMALGMTSLAHALGLVPSRKVAWQNKSTQPAHFLRISGARQVRAFRRAKGAVHEARILKRLSELNREIAPTGYGLISRQVGAVRVVENETIPYEGLVYSLEVAEHETFATGSGLILHNCFPKDLEAFYWISKKKGYDFQLLKAVAEVNDTQKSWIARKVEEELWNPGGKRVAVLGLAFKPNTDDLRFAPSLDIIAKLKESGVKLSVHDPVAMPKAKELLKGVEFAKDPYAALKGADCLALVTEWPEYKNLEFRRIRSLMRNPLILDGRNFLDPAPLRALGFQVRAVGRP
ncbi:MAG: UDP binding domain-containing protein, partial [Elusimicrobiota bacterium]